VQYVELRETADRLVGDLAYDWELILLFVKFSKPLKCGFANFFTLGEIF